MSDSEDPIDPIDEDGGDDLFGDDDDIDIPASPKARNLDDDSLASDPEGDDEPRHSQARARSHTAEAESRFQNVNIMETTIDRHRLPNPSDNTVSDCPSIISAKAPS